MHENGGNTFLCSTDKEIISLILNGVLKNVLVCEQFSSKLAHGI